MVLKTRDNLAVVKRPRGRPPVENPKVQQTIRIDGDVLAHFKASPGWMPRINVILRRAMERELKRQG